MIEIKRIPKRFQKGPISSKELRKIAVQHESAKIMLNVYDMAEQAGMTDGELLNMLHDQVSRMVSKILNKVK